MEVCAALNNCIFYGCVRFLSLFPNDSTTAVIRTASWLTSLICLIVFSATAFFMAYMAIFVVIPAELETTESMFFFFIRLFIACWFFYSVLFHYVKTRMAYPVENPGVPGDKFCIRCNNWKGEQTHHCSGCDRCIWKMDHHCPHMGQCVGAHNQAHFFLFLFNLGVGCLVSLLLTPGFWYNHISNLYDRKETMKDECYWPICFNVWYRVLMTAYDTYSLYVSFLLVLQVMLVLCMFGFLCAYTFMIAGGSTYLLKLSGKEEKTPWTWRVAAARFRRYFQLKSNESFLSLFFIPRSRRVPKYNEGDIVGVWM